MNDLFVETFRRQFGEDRYPGGFLRDYEPIECLSHSQTGETLIVRDRVSGARCVAKCYTDPAILSGAIDSNILECLHHEGMPSFLGEYRNDATLCLVWEYAAGTSLDRLVGSVRLSESEIVSICAQLCDILSYLHGQPLPIIHRDVKPQNVIVDDSGRVKLIDFGIARVYDAGAQQDTVHCGTKHFAAPEQYGFAQTDSRSDIFSLGVLLAWLLTGETDVKRAETSITNRRFARVVAKCTAFSPDDRYARAAAVKDALTGRTAHRNALICLGLTAAIAAVALLGFLPGGGLLRRYTAREVFREPLIEQSIRLALSKDPREPLSKEDLQSVTALYVFGDKAAGDEDTYNTYAAEFAQDYRMARRGSIRSLDDVAKLPNLRDLCLALQDISDLSPLSGLESLERVELKHNPIEDVSPLSSAPLLRSLCLFDTKISDLTALSTCQRLINVDIGCTRVTSMAALEGLNSLQVLSLRKAPLKSLQGVGSHETLEQIHLSETQLQDLTPLLDVPHLRTVEVGESMRSAAEALGGSASFEIVYQ
jgi:serine/threonine protein kinase